MSVLVVPGSSALTEAVVERLVSQGDDVRIIEDDSSLGARWKAFGAHVAPGSAADDDLVERAAQGVRTILWLADISFPRQRIRDKAAAIATGARAAGVDRMVFVSPAGPPSEILDFDHVVLRIRRSPLLGRLQPDAGAIATAVDLADDLPGHPRLRFDITRPKALKQLHRSVEDT